MWLCYMYVVMENLNDFDTIYVYFIIVTFIIFAIPYRLMNYNSPLVFMFWHHLF